MHRINIRRNWSNFGYGRIKPVKVNRWVTLWDLSFALRLKSVFDEGKTTKSRIRLIPFLFLLYFVAFLDRTNISFASLTMNKELGITTQQFGLLSGIFFFGYSLFEVPSNLLLHKIGARVWIARILISWGVVAMLTGFLTGVGQLYVARFSGAALQPGRDE